MSGRIQGLVYCCQCFGSGYLTFTQSLSTHCQFSLSCTRHIVSFTTIGAHTPPFKSRLKALPLESICHHQLIPSVSSKFIVTVLRFLPRSTAEFISDIPVNVLLAEELVFLETHKMTTQTRIQLNCSATRAASSTKTKMTASHFTSRP